MEIKIKRNEDQTIQTSGVLEAGGFICKTLELPDNGNKAGVSCINSGIYNWVKLAPTKKIPYPHIGILNVPNRDGIRIHIANKISELRGCVAVGSAFVGRDLINSRKTFLTLMALLPENGTLIIE